MLLHVTERSEAGGLTQTGQRQRNVAGQKPRLGALPLAWRGLGRRLRVVQNEAASFEYLK